MKIGKTIIAPALIVIRTARKIVCLCAILHISLGISQTIHAMPLNGLISIPSRDFPAKGQIYDEPIISLESSYDFAPEAVDHEGPVKNGEQIETKRVKRYEGFHIIGDFLLQENLLINLGFWDRQIANKRDILDFYTIQAAVQYKLPWKWFDNNYAIRLGWWRNAADALTKSSFTRTDDYKFTSLVLNEPVDNQFQLNFLVSRPLSYGTKVTAFLGVGHSNVDYKSLQGEYADKDDCKFAFDLKQTKGVINQIGRCKSILSRKITMPNTTSIINNVGFNPKDDIKYSSIFLQIGAGAEWKKGLWYTKIGYYFQRFYRDNVDQRVERLGNQSTKNNHSLTAEVCYRFLRPFAVFLRGEYMSSRLLTTAPFIYNSYTADRFSKDGLFFSVGFKLLR